MEEAFRALRRMAPAYQPVITDRRTSASLIHALGPLSALIIGSLLISDTALAVDAECLQRLNDTATTSRQRIAVYAGELKNLQSNPWGRNASSVCTGALNRADQYLKRQTADGSICIPGSSYVDNQAAQLFKSATITCSDQLDDVTRTLPPEEQQLLRGRVTRALSEVR